MTGCFDVGVVGVGSVGVLCPVASSSLALLLTFRDANSTTFLFKGFGSASEVAFSSEDKAGEPVGGVEKEEVVVVVDDEVVGTGVAAPLREASLLDDGQLGVAEPWDDEAGGDSVEESL